MVISAEEKAFASYVAELMQPLGQVRSRAMFGGFGIFLDGVMFALIADSVLYLKADKETEKDFTENGLEPFTYRKKGKKFKMSYFQAPEETLENDQEMNYWASKAYQAALRAASGKQKRT